MKFNKWTVGLAAVGVVSLASAARADEKMSQLQTALSSTTLSGYVDTSAQWNLGSQNGGATPVATPNGAGGKADGFNLNAVDLVLDHPEDSSPWAAGYHVELQLGPDAQPFGPVTQAYMTLHTPVGNGLDWKVGEFDTIIGYESINDPANPNYTRSYGYEIEPTTHTGVLATYTVSSAVSVSAGVADTYTDAAGINSRATYESQKTYLGSVVLTAPDSWGWAKGSALTLGVIDALSGAGFAGGASGGITSYYAGATMPTPWAPLKVGAAFDYKDLHGGGSALVLGLYTTYQATDKLSLNARAEYLEDDGAGIYSAAGPGIPDNQAEEFTLTAQYNIWANVMSRVEFRVDHVEHGNAFDLSSAGVPDHSNAYLLALNLIYQF
jgi:hypothetical protein